MAHLGSGEHPSAVLHLTPPKYWVSPLSHSQEGMPRSVADVGDGLHVDVVVMQRLGIRRGARLRQQDAEPPPEFLRAAGLKKQKPKEETQERQLQLLTTRVSLGNDK